MRERQRGEHDVVGRQRHHRSRPRALREIDGGVREQRALRPARRAGGVEHQRGRDGRVARRPLGTFGLHVLEQQRRLQIRQDLRALLGFQQRVEGSDRDAGLESAEYGDHELPAVRDHERDAVAGMEPTPGQRPREPARPCVQLAVGEGPAVPDERRPLGLRVRGGLHVRREIHGDPPRLRSCASRLRA